MYTQSVREDTDAACCVGFSDSFFVVDRITWAAKLAVLPIRQKMSIFVEKNCVLKPKIKPDLDSDQTLGDKIKI